MTATTSLRPTLLLCALAAVAAYLIGCAAAPVEPVKESVDDRTGVTVTQLGRPVELLATAARGKSTDPFAYLAPFETNRMGERSAYLWIAVPADEPLSSTPTLYLDDRALELRHLPSLEATGLHAAPYARPAPWSTEYFYSLTEAEVGAIARARTLAVTVRYGASGEQRYASQTLPADLIQFAERVAPP